MTEFRGGNLAWVDYETTGLDPKKDLPIELGIVVTDCRLTVLDSRSWVIAAPNLDLDTLPERVLEMHLANGLLEELAADKGQPMYDVCNEAEKFLRTAQCFGVEIDSGPWRSPMCGSTVHFDRSFMREHMPKLERVFQYRNIDASSFWQLAANLGLQISKAEHGKHRAVQDCLDSIALLKKCWRVIQVGGDLAP
jgi:oligoribonuclease